MAEVILSTKDLVVFGGPAKIDVDLDIGPKGPRGSRIYGVEADPRVFSTELPEDIQDFDLAIVVSSSDAEYLSVFQKLGPSINDWLPLVSLTPKIFSKRIIADFVSGTADISEALQGESLSAFFQIESPMPSMFQLQVSVEDMDQLDENLEVISEANNYPNSSSFSFNVIDDIIDLRVQAIEFDGTGWNPVSGSRVLHLMIAVV